MNFWRIRRLARHGKYLTHMEYWVRISEIHIAEHLTKEDFGQRRMKLERNYYKTMGLYETRIILDRKFNLIDGYISILLALENGEDTVPVNFVNVGGNTDEDF